MLFKAHLTTIVQHHEGRARLPLQQPPPTTATDPLPSRGALDEGKKTKGGRREGGTDSTSTADYELAYPRAAKRMKITSEMSVKFEFSLIYIPTNALLYADDL